jgi:hypothetical protein
MNRPGRLRPATAVARQKKAAVLGLAWYLTGARWPWRSNAPNLTRKEAKRRGDHGGAHLGQQITQRVGVAAHGGGAAPLGPGDDGGSLRWASG